MLFEEFARDNTAHSPVRTQYLQIKQQNPDTILFFRMGDFYEMFDDDADHIKKIVQAMQETTSIVMDILSGIHATDQKILVV